MIKEIYSQVEYINKFKYIRQEKKRIIYIGSGDSFVSGLLAQQLFPDRVTCATPADVLLNSSLLDGKAAYIISISGKTISNIKVARIAQERRISTCAITASVNSDLSKHCDNVIELKYPTNPVVTSGTLSFIASMLTCISLAGGFNLSNAVRLFNNANTAVKNIKLKTKKSGNFIFLGNGPLYCISLYGSLKVNEVLGKPSQSFQLDEYFHAPIFGLRAYDNVTVLADNAHDIRLVDKLEKIHPAISSLFIEKRSGIFNSLLEAIFYIQLYVVRVAMEWKYSECFFTQSKRTLSVSSDVIY